MNNKQENISDRSWIVTFLLCIFGFSGLHRLYTGHVTLAVLYFFTCGFFLIGVIFDFFSLLFGEYTDVSGKTLN